MRNSRLYLLLGLTLVAFILKGLVFISLIPMHQGSDEPVHYATVQHLAEPKEKYWTIERPDRAAAKDTKEVAEFYYTEEIRAFGRFTHSELFSGTPFNSQELDPEIVASVEQEMRSDSYLPVITHYPPVIVPHGAGDLSHRIASWIERFFADRDAFDRYAAVRSLAILYGLVIILCAYFIALWSGLRKEHSLLLAAIVAFHPQLTATTSIINYDPLLIAATSAAILAAVSILRHRLNAWSTLGILVATAIAFLAKSTGGILFFFTAGALFWGVRERWGWLRRQALWKLALTAIVLFGIVFALSPRQYTSILTSLPSMNNRGDHLLPHILDYLDGGVFDEGKIERTSTTYWGTFGWLDTTLHGSVMTMIRLIQYVGVPGIIIFLFLSFVRFLPFRNACKKLDTWTRGYFSEIRGYLPEAKYAWLFLFSIVLLQAAVRFYDWYGRYVNGEGVGTPGRYFLPNIIPHFMLLVIGFGMLVKSERALGLILRTLLVLMVLLNLYSVFWIIIPRYYL